MTRLHKLRKQQLDTQNRNFPDGLVAVPTLLIQAKEEAEAYFKTTYGVD
jgi:hypothetical protein